MGITEVEIYEAMRRALADHEAQRPDQVFSVPQTARKLGKSYETLRRMIKEGTIESCADGRNVSQAQINAYLKVHPKPLPTEKKQFPDLPPKKRLVNIEPGYTAIIIPTDDVERVREAMETADIHDMSDYYEPIIENAKIITNDYDNNRDN
nr:helix-turn-helix domain-containing protein [uncultured Draconibacterium sp.]